MRYSDTSYERIATTETAVGTRGITRWDYSKF